MKKVNDDGEFAYFLFTVTQPRQFVTVFIFKPFMALNVSFPIALCLAMAGRSVGQKKTKKKKKKKENDS